MKVIEHIYSCETATRIPSRIRKRFPGAKLGMCEQCGNSVVYNEPAFRASVAAVEKLGLTLSKVCALCVNSNLERGGEYIAIEAAKP